MGPDRTESAPVGSGRVGFRRRKKDKQTEETTDTSVSGFVGVPGPGSGRAPVPEEKDGSLGPSWDRGGPGQSHHPCVPPVKGLCRVCGVVYVCTCVGVRCVCTWVVCGYAVWCVCGVVRVYIMCGVCTCVVCEGMRCVGVYMGGVSVCVVYACRLWCVRVWASCVSTCSVGRRNGTKTSRGTPVRRLTTVGSGLRSRRRGVAYV